MQGNMNSSVINGVNRVYENPLETEENDLIDNTQC